MRVGLIADTHGLLRPEALAALRGAASPPKLENAMDERRDPEPNPDSDVPRR